MSSYKTNEVSNAELRHGTPVELNKSYLSLPQSVAPVTTVVCSR
jgi:hypothetical protein